ncbi:MAG: AAA family ATPase [Bacteroidetes bacterium]|nr:MAG: AAA family ATPase [Bacteroidota bacterium]PTM08639.1 MAG: AAA family ATPase [Bacteroidota bacterium]
MLFFPYLHPMKYPIGIQDFRRIRTEDYVYVDKTRHIYEMLEGGVYFFLSRPRRFGKSLLLSTMNELYSGSRDLFEGLWIHDQWDWEAQRRPVIWLKFATFQYKDYPLRDAIFAGLAKEAERLGVSPPDGEMVHPLLDLLQKINAHYGEKAVLLIDEYDKPIIDFLDDIARAESNRDTLKWLYSILKDSDALLEKIFITGVSAFSKVSIFSDLNHLSNLTLHRNAYTLLGITHAEVLAYFTEPLQVIANEMGVSLAGVIDQTARWYNGYSWGGKERVYNPFSLLSFLGSRQFQNFWFQTGTPTFLVKEMRQQKLYNPSGREFNSSDLSNFDFTRLNPITVLFQTGYLTVTHYDAELQLYSLDYPNKEVRSSLEQMLINIYLDDHLEGAASRVGNILRALRRKDLDTVITIFNATFAGIPAQLWQKDNEHFYHALIHLTFSLLGAYVHSEVNTANGRCDALVETADHIYAFEFKLDKPVAEAMQQIRDRGYLAPYADSPKQKIAVGINFSKQKKAVADWAAEEM